MSELDKSTITQMLSGELESVEVNGFEVRAIHPTPSTMHLVIYDENDEMTGTLDGNRYNGVEDFMNAARRQVGLDAYEEGLGDLFG